MFSSVMSGVVLQEALQLMTNLEFDQNVCRTETGGSKHGSVSSYCLRRFGYRRYKLVKAFRNQVTQSYNYYLQVIYK